MINICYRLHAAGRPAVDNNDYITSAQSSNTKETTSKSTVCGDVDPSCRVGFRAAGQKWVSEAAKEETIYADVVPSVHAQAVGRHEHEDLDGRNAIVYASLDMSC